MRQDEVIGRIIELAHRQRNADQDAKIQRAVPCFCGPAQAGKSAIAEQKANDIAEKREDEDDVTCGVKVLDASEWEHPSDILGFPETQEHEQLGEMTDFLQHRWFKEMEQFDEGILIIDELLNMDPNIHDVAKNFILYGRLGQYSISDDWTIVTITNPPTEDDEYMVFDIDESFRSRLVWIPVVFDRDSYMAYLDNREYDPHVQGFIEQNPNLINWEQDLTLPYQIKPGPRRAELLNIMYDPSISDDIAHYLVRGTLGKEAAQQFQDYREKADIEQIDAEDILTEYPNVRDRVVNLAQSGNQYGTVNNLAEQVVAFLESEKNNGENLGKYRQYLSDFLDDLPEDLAQSYVHRISDIDPEIVDEQELLQGLDFGDPDD